MGKHRAPACTVQLDLELGESVDMAVSAPLDAVAGRTMADTAPLWPPVRVRLAVDRHSQRAAVLSAHRNREVVYDAAGAAGARSSVGHGIRRHPLRLGWRAGGGARRVVG